MMLVDFLIVLMGILGLVNAIETHGGVQFDIRWTNTSSPLDDPIKDLYEAAAAKNAYNRLNDTIHQYKDPTKCLAGTNSTPAGVYALKDCLVAEKGSGIFFDLLANDIAGADAFWKRVVAESSSERYKWVPARTFVRGYFGGSLSATQFAVWTASPFSDAANLHANPEHYFIQSAATSAVSQASAILEGWGGVLSRFGTMRTNFTVPDFAKPTFGGDTNHPQEWELSAAFPPALQRIGDKVLGDGTTVGVLHIAARDFAAGETPVGVAGVEVYAAVWYPAWDRAAAAANQTEFGSNFLPDEARHMVQEIIADTLQAKADCATGRCVPPS